VSLGAFITDNMDAIVDDWIAFSRATLPAAEPMPEVMWSDHGRAILRGIALQLESHRAAEQSAAMGAVDDGAAAAPETSASAHGAACQSAGFDLVQLIGEFRWLRANVVVFWRRSRADGQPGEALDGIDDIVRFDHAIDQALTESVQRYMVDMRRASDTFLAVLGHDLRNPLWVIQASSQLLVTQTLAEPIRRQATLRIWRSAKVMDGLITDFLAYARTRLGRRIPIARSACNLRRLCEDALDGMRAIHPQREFVQELGGDLVIQADPPRLQQVLSNLLSNAVEHGDDRAPVSLEARGDADGIVLKIANSGCAMAPEALQKILEPPVQVPRPLSASRGDARSGLGLGLYIVHEIVRGHEGEVSAESSAAGGAVFTVRLPRAPRKPV
jgi:signal transduction histidine kinase